MGYVEDLRKLVGHRPLILVGSIVIIINEKQEVLLQKRTFPYGVWGLPGGLMELAESTEDCARREVFEETGLTLGKLQLITVYSGPKSFVIAENGDEFYVVTIVYATTDIVHGNLKVKDEESLKFDYFALDSLPNQMVGSHRRAIHDYLSTQK